MRDQVSKIIFTATSLLGSVILFLLPGFLLLSATQELFAIDPKKWSGQNGRKGGPPPPRVTILTPQAGALVKGSVVVTGNVNVYLPTTILVNGRATTIKELQTELLYVSYPVPLKAGINTIEAVAYADDDTGRKHSTSITVNADPVPPLITLSEAYHNRITTNPSLTIKGTMGEPGRVTLNGAPYKANDDTYAFEASTRLREGTSQLILIASDPAGNETRLVLLVTLDSRPPEITSMGPPDNTWIRQADTLVTGQIYEFAELTCNGKTQTVRGGTKFSIGVQLEEGTNVITIMAKDKAGNTSWHSLRLNLDTKPPVLTCSGLTDGALTNQSKITVSGSLSEPATLKLNGSPVYIGPDNHFSETVYLLEGANEITLNAVDRAGNTAGHTFYVTLDTGRPVIRWSGPANDSWTDQEKIAITGELNKKATLTLNGTAVTLGSDLRFTADLTLKEGPNEFVLEATDPAGNTTRETIRYTLDTTPGKKLPPPDTPPKKGPPSEGWSSSNPLHWIPAAEQHGLRKLKVEVKNKAGQITSREVEIFVVRRPHKPEDFSGGN